MVKKASYTYSAYTKKSLALMSALIRTARKEHKITAKELAERAGISRDLLWRIEKGDPKCSVGAVFEVATLAGVKLFDADEENISKELRLTKEKLSLLPMRVRKSEKPIDDDF